MSDKEKAVNLVFSLNCAEDELLSEVKNEHNVISPKEKYGLV